MSGVLQGLQKELEASSPRLLWGCIPVRSQQQWQRQVERTVRAVALPVLSLLSLAICLCLS